MAEGKFTITDKLMLHWLHMEGGEILDVNRKIGNIEITVEHPLCIAPELLKQVYESEVR